jgi:hypothetical protein
LSSTDVLIAMLSSDLSGTHGESGLPRYGSRDSRECVDLAAGSSRLPRMGSEGEPATEPEIVPEIGPALDRLQLRRP